LTHPRHDTKEFFKKPASTHKQRLAMARLRVTSAKDISVKSMALHAKVAI